MVIGSTLAASFLVYRRGVHVSRLAVSSFVGSPKGSGSSAPIGVRNLK